jgi:hypothetical protein
MLTAIHGPRASAFLALLAAAIITITKAVLNEDLWWPFATVEYLASTLLVSGAVLVLRGGLGRLLTAGWGFTAGITWSTLFHHLQEKPSPGVLELALGLLLAAAACGIVLAITQDRTAISSQPHQ